MHQVSLVTLLNGVANSILAISALHLILKVFGRPDSLIWTKPFAAILCKIATTVTVCGAISNILTFSTPALSELLLNIGVSLNFLWISFYYGHVPLVKNTPKRNRQKAPRKRTTRRTT